MISQIFLRGFDEVVTTQSKFAQSLTFYFSRLLEYPSQKMVENVLL